MTFDLDCTDYSECKIGRCQKPTINSFNGMRITWPRWSGNLVIWERHGSLRAFYCGNQISLNERAQLCHCSNNKHKIHVPSSVSWTGRSSFVTKQTQRPKKADITCFSSFFCSCTETKTMGQHLITGRFFIRMQMYLEIRSLSNLSLIIYLE